MSTISEWWRALHQRSHNKTTARQQAQAEHDIQCREFGGRLFVSFAGVPLIEAETSEQALKLVKAARENYVKYQQARNT